MNKEVDYSKRKVFHTVCAILSSDLHKRFVNVCKHKGLTVNETLKNFVENYVAENEYNININKNKVINNNIDSESIDDLDKEIY